MLDVAGALSDNGRTMHINAYLYNLCVFVFPSWLETYHTDQERDQSFSQAVDVFNGIKAWYAKQGYIIIGVPKLTIDDRVNFIESRIGHALIKSVREELLA